MRTTYKLIALAFLCVALFAACKTEKVDAPPVYISSSFHEPADEGLRFIYSYDGIHWDAIPGTWLKPRLGNHQIMRDPSITRTPDGTYHLVWTTSWKGDKGFGYAHSKDLINWSEQKLINVMEHEPTTVNVWAPEIFYDDERKEFVVVWASCIPNRFENGVEEAENNHRLYYITTKDFETISETRLFYDPGFSAIDAVIIKRDKRDYVMVVKDNTRPNRNLKVAFAQSPTGPYGPASDPFTDEFVEGPSVVKLDNEYYIYYDAYREKIYGAVKTGDFTAFTDETKNISIPQGHKHGTIFTAPVGVLKNLLTHSEAKAENK